MRQKLFLFLLLLFSSNLVFAQEDTVSVLLLPRYAVGISPTSFLNSYGAFQISQDFGITDNINLSLETGYIYSSYYRKREVSGYRIRPVLEFYFNRVGNIAFGLGVFALYRNVQETYRTTVNNWRERYREQVPITKSKILKGAGMQVFFKTMMSENIYFDFGIGLGKGVLVVKDISEKPINRERFIFFGWDSFDTVGQWNYPIIYFNLNVSYKLY